MSPTGKPLTTKVWVAILVTVFVVTFLAGFLPIYLLKQNDLDTCQDEKANLQTQLTACENQLLRAYDTTITVSGTELPSVVLTNDSVLWFIVGRSDSTSSVVYQNFEKMDHIYRTTEASLSDQEVVINTNALTLTYNDQTTTLTPTTNWFVRKIV